MAAATVYVLVASVIIDPGYQACILLYKFLSSQLIWKLGHALQPSTYLENIYLSCSGVDQRADGHDSILWTSESAFEIAPSFVIYGMLHALCKINT